MLTVVDTLFLLIFKSDRTHLLNFACNKKQWPGYMTISILSSKIRRRPSTHSVVLVVPLPIPIKNHNISHKRLDEQRQTNQEVLNEVLWRVVQPLTNQLIPCSEGEHDNVLCADGNSRHCNPEIAAPLADCTKYSTLQQLERHVFWWCECPKNALGDNIPPDKQHPQRDHHSYGMFNDANTNAGDAELSPHHVHQWLNVFRHIPYIVSDLLKSDLPHTLQIDILHHLQKWIVYFMKTHEQLDKYNAIWLSVPAYLNLTQKTKLYQEVSQWNGKEMKEMSRRRLGVVTQSLHGESPAQRPIFCCAIECTWALGQFYL